ncbi:uncharacterized protein [Misgurnus anguillicaudatus]|uniref:uncharacterized protein n=1 Tax=Misgurnus anguillicaudatus TaxID=75329 RepID=UPI003CCFBF60
MKGLVFLDSSVSNFTVVLFGNSESVQFGCDNILIGENQPCTEDTEFFTAVLLKRKILDHHVSVINMIGLYDTNLNTSDQVISQLVNENEIHAFIFVVRLCQLTDADKMGIEWLQRMFGDKVLQFVMILFTYERDEESDNIIDELKKNPILEKLIEKCGQKYHICSKIMNNQSEMRGLMDQIRCLFIDNKEQCYTTEMYNTVLRNPQNSENQSGPDVNRSTRSQLLASSAQPKNGDRQRLEGSNLCLLHLLPRLEGLNLSLLHIPSKVNCLSHLNRLNRLAYLNRQAYLNRLNRLFHLSHLFQYPTYQHLIIS